jgi:transcriptional regulator with XRE-family HTH domain
LVGVTLRDVRRSGLTLAELAGRAGVPYSRVWRSAQGGLTKGLQPDEEARLQRVLEEAAAAPA